jgi:hypothetical protein
LYEKKYIFLIFTLAILVSCGSRNSGVTKPKTNYPTENLRNLNSKFVGKNSSTVNKILEEAEDFLELHINLVAAKSGLVAWFGNHCFDGRI